MFGPPRGPRGPPPPMHGGFGPPMRGPPPPMMYGPRGPPPPMYVGGYGPGPGFRQPPPPVHYGPPPLGRRHYDDSCCHLF